MSKQCDIVRDILPLYVDGACSEASAEMVKEHLNACADCNAIYQKLLSHTSEDVLHEESESVIMRHEAKEKQRGRKKITIAVLVSIALCIIAIFTALFLLPINIAYEPVKIDFPSERLNLKLVTSAPAVSSVVLSFRDKPLNLSYRVFISFSATTTFFSADAGTPS